MLSFHRKMFYVKPTKLTNWFYMFIFLDNWNACVFALTLQIQPLLSQEDFQCTKITFFKYVFYFFYSFFVVILLS